MTDITQLLTQFQVGDPGWPAFAVCSMLVTRRPAASIMAGSLTPMLDLNYLSKQADLKPGQKVYTSGVGGVFPSGLFVGTVRSFQVRALDGQAKLAPAVDLAKLEDVFVVIGSK